MVVRFIFVIVLLSKSSDGIFMFGNHNPFLERMLTIGHNYVNRITQAVLTTAKNGISNCADATAEVASKVADHTYTTLRWKRSLERDLRYTLRNMESITNDYRNMEQKINANFNYFFADSANKIRRSVNEANVDLVVTCMQLAIRSTPAMHFVTDSFLRQMLTMSDLFLHGVEGCINEAEDSSEANVNRFARAVSQVPDSVKHDLSAIDNCRTTEFVNNRHVTMDPYLNCAGGAVEDMIQRVRRDVVNVGLTLPTTAFGFANIGSKVSLCLTDKIYAAKSRIDALALELSKAMDGNIDVDSYFSNSIFSV